MTSGLALTFALIWSLFLSNWLTSILGFAAVGPLSRLTIVRVDRLVPVVLVMATIGAFAQHGRIADVWVAWAFGVAGYLMKRHGWPRIAFVMALVLGPLFETNLRLTISLERLDRISVWSRPAVIVLLVMTVLTLMATLRKDQR